MKTITLILSILVSFNSYSINYSKQKIYIKGNVKKPVTYTIEEMSKLPQVSIRINDPYSKNKLIKFQGILLADLFKRHANEGSSKVEVIALNDYKVTIEKSYLTSERMLLAIKGDDKFLTVKDKGPARIVVPGKGSFKDGTLAKEGVDWVWFVRTIKFL